MSAAQIIANWPADAAATERALGRLDDGRFVLIERLGQNPEAAWRQIGPVVAFEEACTIAEAVLLGHPRLSTWAHTQHIVCLALAAVGLAARREPQPEEGGHGAAG